MAKQQKMRVHFAGWVSLSKEMCKLLGAETGDDISAEIVGDTVVLRGNASSAAPSLAAIEEDAAPASAAAMPPETPAKAAPAESSPAPEAPAKTAPGKSFPAKTRATRKPAASLALPKLKGRGRKGSLPS